MKASLLTLSCSLITVTGHREARTWLEVIMAITALLSSPADAVPVTVRFSEGVTHGFLLVRSLAGETIGRGEMTQVVKEGDLVESRLVLHFKDGSLHDEKVAFSQQQVFTMIRYHLVQQGPSFPEQLDVSVNRGTGDYKVRSKARKDAQEQVLTGVRPVVFRAPSLWIGETTLRALEDEGYRYDSSVPARRFDCGFGRVHYLKYFRAPCEPYRLSSYRLSLPGYSSIIEMAPSAFLLPTNMATLRVLGLPVMKWMVRRISRRASRLVFYCHPYEFVDANRQSFPHNMSKWNMQGMTPENFTLLEGFVEHMMRQNHSPALFVDSLSTVRGLRSRAHTVPRFLSDAVDGVTTHEAPLSAGAVAGTHVGTPVFKHR
jgi:hypothetical protein